MALKITTTIKASQFKKLRKKLRLLKKPIDKKTAEKAGKAAVKEMKLLISKGTSPIQGGGFGGKFPRYKNPDRYPGKLKAHTPVNLKLTGKFLANLKSTVVKTDDGFGAEIGYKNAKQAIKEQGHREGANTQPKRPTIPKPPREKFAQRIISKYRKVFEKRIRKITRK